MWVITRGIEFVLISPSLNIVIAFVDVSGYVMYTKLCLFAQRQASSLNAFFLGALGLSPASCFCLVNPGASGLEVMELRRAQNWAPLQTWVAFLRVA